MSFATELALVAFAAHALGWLFASVLAWWLSKHLQSRPLVPDDCIFGRCGCQTALQCKFPRCQNCDNVVDGKGATLDSRWGEEWQRCPDCGGKFAT